MLYSIKERERYGILDQVPVMEVKDLHKICEQLIENKICTTINKGYSEICSTYTSATSIIDIRVRDCIINKLLKYEGLKE